MQITCKDIIFYTNLSLQRKHKSTWQLLYKQQLWECFKVYENYIKFDTNRKKATQKALKDNN